MTSVCILPQHVIAATKHTLVNNMASQRDNRAYTRTRKAVTARLMTSVCILPQRVIAATKHTLVNNMASQCLHSNTEDSNSQADDQCMYPPTTRYCGDETYTRQQHGITARQQGLHSNTEGSNSQADDQCMYPPTTRYCGDKTYTRQQHGITARRQGLHSNTEGSNSQADDQCMYPPTTRYCGDKTYTGQQHGITYQPWSALWQQMSWYIGTRPSTAPMLTQF